MGSAKRKTSSQCPSSSSSSRMVQDEFVAITMKDEEFVELDPRFVNRFKGELSEFWELTDPFGNDLRIRFNQSVDRPLMIGGCDVLRKLYSLEGNHGVLMTYMGDSKFKINVFKKPSDCFCFPSYHSRSKKPESRKFTVTLTEYTATRSQLTLNKEFANFMRKYKHRTVRMFGPWKYFIHYKVMISKIGKKQVKFGEGWMEFCQKSKYKGGDVLQFECKEAFNSRVIYVTRISTN